MTRILTYTGSDSDEAKELIREVERAVPYATVDQYVSIDEYTEELQKPCSERVVLLAMASTREELNRVCKLGPVMGGHPLVLILPDRDSTTIFNGHILMPRLIGFLDNGFDDVAEVLPTLIPSGLKSRAYTPTPVHSESMTC